MAGLRYFFVSIPLYHVGRSRECNTENHLFWHWLSFLFLKIYCIFMEASITCSFLILDLFFPLEFLNLLSPYFLLTSPSHTYRFIISGINIIEPKCNESCLTSVNSLDQNNELTNNWTNTIKVSLFHHLLTLIVWCNGSLFPIILNSLLTDSLQFPPAFTHGFIQLFFNVMNRIKIINQVWLWLLLILRIR